MPDNQIMLKPKPHLQLQLRLRNWQALDSETYEAWKGTSVDSKNLKLLVLRIVLASESSGRPWCPENKTLVLW